MSQHGGGRFHIHAAVDRNGSKCMPLLHNKDKLEYPCGARSWLRGYDGKLASDESDAKIVRKIFEMSANGQSLGAILDWLYETRLRCIAIPHIRTFSAHCLYQLNHYGPCVRQPENALNRKCLHQRQQHGMIVLFDYAANGDLAEELL